MFHWLEPYTHDCLSICTGMRAGNICVCMLNSTVPTLLKPPRWHKQWHPSSGIPVRQCKQWAVRQCKQWAAAAFLLASIAYQSLECPCVLPSNLSTHPYCACLIAYTRSCLPTPSMPPFMPPFMPSHLLRLLRSMPPLQPFLAAVWCTWTPGTSGTNLSSGSGSRPARYVMLHSEPYLQSSLEVHVPFSGKICACGFFQKGIVHIPPLPSKICAS